MRLVENKASVFAALGCSNATADRCGDLSAADRVFEWRTHFMHDSTTYLINENGDNEMPQEAKILTAALPADLAARSLSGKDYAGKTIKFRFENDWIMGLPKM